MTKDELIGQQAYRIASLENEVSDLRARMTRISLECVGIGGPLNDNVLQYTKEQLGPFFRIEELTRHLT